MTAERSYTAEERRRLQRFSTLAAIVTAVFAVVTFYSGISFLRNDVFTSYYNPSRHTIVQQDPETQQVLAWQDRAGHVYSRESADVRFFPYGMTALILLVMGLSTGLHRVLVRYYEAEMVRGEPVGAPSGAGRTALSGTGRVGHSAR